MEQKPQEQTTAVLPSQPNSNNPFIYPLAIVAGSALSLILGEVSNLIKTQGILNPQTSYPRIIQEIYREGGIQGFSNGMKSALTGEIIKLAIRTGVAKESKEFLDNKLPEQIKEEYPLLTKYLSFSIMAGADTLNSIITGGIEVKQRQHIKNPPAIHEIIKRSSLRDLFNGWQAVALKKGGSWSASIATLATMDYVMGKKEKDTPTGNEIIVKAAAVSIITNILTMPLEAARVHMQIQKNNENTSLHNKAKQSFLEVLQELAKSGRLTRGLAPRMLGGFFGLVPSIMALEYVTQTSGEPGQRR